MAEVNEEREQLARKDESIKDRLTGRQFFQKKPDAG